MRRVASGALPCLSMNRAEGDGSVSDPGAGATRRELPSDALDLAPMGEAFERAIDSGLAELGIADGPAGTQRARRSYEAHARLLRDWGAVINLTAIREPADVARRHVCDSLSAVPHLSGLVRSPMSLLDIGSGGGYPGLPLAAALPLARVGLLDSVSKKARFLAVADLDKMTSLDRLNSLFDEWLEHDYHRRVHSGVKERPLDRYMRSLASSRPRKVSREELDLVFYRTLNRKVRGDCTVSIAGHLWEAPADWMGKTVEIRHPLDEPDQLYLFAGGKPVCRLRPVNLIENARTSKPIRFSLYDDEEES